jgi:hypothetical protein
MGFLNALTGGAATIQMNLQKTRFAAGENIFAWITVTANDNINAEAIVLHIYAVEQTHEVRCNRCNQNVMGHNETVFNNEINIAGPQQMFRGEVRQFQGAIMVPQGIAPTYMGRHATNRWYLEARVKMFGNDPDTKIEIQIFG